MALVGDSYAVGLHRPLEREIAKLGWRFLVCRAHEGIPISEVTRRGRQVVLDDAANLVIVSCGANDASNPAAASLQADEFESWAREHGVVVVWLEPPPGARVWSSPARGHSDRIVSAPPELHLADGQHPNGAGYQLWSERIAKRLPRLVEHA